jgi:hypothetical protein
VIENAARYQHSFVNELAIFNLMNIDTHAFWLRLEQMEFSAFQARASW